MIKSNGIYNNQLVLHNEGLNFSGHQLGASHIIMPLRTLNALFNVDQGKQRIFS